MDRCCFEAYGALMRWWRARVLARPKEQSDALDDTLSSVMMGVTRRFSVARGETKREEAGDTLSC